MSGPDITHPDDVAAGIDVSRKMGSGELTRATLDKRYIHADGRIISALVNISLVRDADGSPLHAVVQVQDVTEQKRAEAQLAYHAYHDVLTGLPEQAAADGGPRGAAGGRVRRAHAAAALRPRRLQGLQRRLRPPGGRLAARPPRRAPAGGRAGPRRRLPHGRRRVLRPRAAAGGRRRRAGRRRPGGADRAAARASRSRLRYGAASHPAGCDDGRRGARHRRPAHVRAQGPPAHLRRAPGHRRAAQGSAGAQPRPRGAPATTSRTSARRSAASSASRRRR